MKRNYLILMFFIFKVSFLLAQYDDKVEIKPHKVKLSVKKEEPLKTPFYFDGLIDNRFIKKNIGIAQKGAFNRKVPAVFNNGFQKELSNYFSFILPENKGVPVTFRINRLLISEYTGAFKETGDVTLAMDMILEKDGVKGVVASCSSFVKKNGLDVTGKHDERIQEAIKICIKKIDSTDWNNVSPIAISDKPLEPKFFDERPKEGLFLSFSELYSNMPIKQPEIKLEKNSNDDRYYLMKEGRRIRHSPYYAYSDGLNLYLNSDSYSSDSHFVKADIIGKYLVFNDTFVNPNKVTGMAVAFGMLGVLMSNENNDVLIDLYTSKMYIVNRSTLKKLAKNNPDLWKKYKKASEEQITIQELLIELEKNGDLDLEKIYNSK